MSDLLKRLVEKRANVWEQAKTHLDTAEERGDDLSGESEETWRRHMAELDQLDQRIGELSELAQRNKDAEEVRAKFGDVPATEARAEASDEAILRRMAAGEIKGHEFRPAERRDLTVGSATAGGNTVPTSFHDRLIEHLIEVSAIRQTNVTVLQTDSGEAIKIPKTTSYSAAAIVGEGASIGESDPAFGQVTLDAFKYAFTTQFSTELEQDSAINLVDFLARQGARALALGTDAHFVAGDGSSKPNGVVTAATTGVTGGTGVGGKATADNLIDLYFSVIAPYRANASWLASDATVAELRKLKDTTNQYLWQPGLVQGEPNTLLGKPLFVDTNVPDPATSAASVVFGDLSAYYIRLVRGVRVERSDDFAFGNDLVTYRFIQRADGDLIDTTGAVKKFVGGAS